MIELSKSYFEYLSLTATEETISFRINVLRRPLRQTLPDPSGRGNKPSGAFGGTQWGLGSLVGKGYDPGFEPVTSYSWLDLLAVRFSRFTTRHKAEDVSRSI